MGDFVTLRPARGGDFFGVEKCARPKINKSMTETQKTCVEKIRELWQELLPAVDYEAWTADLFLATLCVHVSKVIRLLIQGKIAGAEMELWKSQHLLITSKTAAEAPEILHQSLHILDIGNFAWSLAAYSRYAWALEGYTKCFCDIVEVAKEIWNARENFAPLLSDALIAAHKFMFNLKYSNPMRAFFHALRSSKFEDGFAIYSTVYGKKPIGHLLETAAMAKLKDIIRAYVRGCIGRPCAKKPGA